MKEPKFENISLEIQNTESYAILTMERSKALNALNYAILKDIQKAIAYLTHLERQKEISAVLIRGRERAFCAGADISAMYKMDVEENLAFLKYGQDVLEELYQARFISIAAIHGAAFGGGLELALACTLRIATSQAKMGLPEVCLGIYPGFGGTQRLPRIVGMGRAAEIILSGRALKSEEALALNLINHVIQEKDGCSEIENCFQGAEKYITQLLARPSKQAQLAAWEVMRKGMDASNLEQALKHEFEGFRPLISPEDSDVRDGMATFLEKRRANFSKA